MSGSGENLHYKPVYFELIPKEKLEIPLCLNDKLKQKKVADIVQPVVLSPEIYDKVAKVFDEQMNLALEKDQSEKSCLYMLNTYLPELEFGKEEGNYLAIDLGGTNFRVCWIEFKNGQIIALKDKHYTVPEHVYQGTGTGLFEYLADCIKETLEDFELIEKDLPLGFTFSFPINQTALDVGILLCWVINYNCSGVIGEDVVPMLKSALKKKLSRDVQVTAIVNDMSSVLAYGIYLDPRTAIGAGIGSGINACYIEKSTNVKCWNEKIPKGQNEVAIDTEFCAFGDNGCLDFIKTEYDAKVDAMSQNPNVCVLEKYTGGNFMGELVRLIICKLVAAGVLFAGKGIEIFNQKGIFASRFISECEKDFLSVHHEHTKEVLKELGLLDLATDDDMIIIRYICSIITMRACRIVAICLANMIKRINRPDVTVAFDGSVYKKHPKVHSLITHFISDLLPEQKFRLMLAENGSCIGAGLIAAVAVRQQKN